MSWVGVDVGAAGRSGSLVWAQIGADGAVGASGATPIVADYVAGLGSPEPVIVGATPYGREALIGEALREIVTEGAGDGLSGLGLVHDDDLDAYRLTLLVEAARLAGVAPDQVVLMPRSRTAAGDDEESRRAATAALAMLPGSAAAGAAGGASAAVAAAGVGGAAGGAILGSQLLEGGATALAAGAAAGPAGAALAGPAGTALAGPAGTALAGPAGSTIAGAAGTPLGAAGPSGNVLVPVAQVASKAKWIPIIGGAAVGVAAIVGIAVLATGGDDDQPAASQPPAAITTPDATPETTPPTDPPSTTTADTTPVAVVAETTTTEATTTTTTTTEVTTTTAPPAADFTVLLGTWQTGCVTDFGGSLTAVYTISGSSPDAMNFHADTTAFVTEGCVGDGQPFSYDDPMAIAGRTMVDGLDTFQVTTPDGNGIMAVDGDTLYIGAFDDTTSFPTSFDPMWTCTRV